MNARFVALSLLTLFALFLAPAALAQKAAELKQTMQQLEAAKKEEKALAAKMQKAQDELKNLQSKAMRLAADVQQSEIKMLRTEKLLHAASKRRESAMRQFSKSREAYRATVLTLLRLRQLPASVVLVPEDQQDTMRQTASVIANVEKALRKQMKTLQVAQAQFEKAQADARKAHEALVAGQEKLRAEQSDLDKALQERQAVYATLSTKHRDARAQAEKLARTSKNLQELIAGLDAKSRVQASKALTLRNITRAKGTLRTPVAGALKHKFGDRKSENERYKGVVLASRASATVVAPYDGEIAYSGSFREYGPMVLIRHSGGYMSLLAGLGKLNVLVGTKVRAGEPVGKMGTAAPNLYLELRAGGKPIDPAPWYAKL